MAGKPRDPRKEAIADETRRLRRLQLTVRLVMNVISQGNLPFEEASEMVAATRRVALDLFPGKEETYDLIYQPRETRFLRLARRSGHRTLNGLGMLICQGAAAFRLWTGRRAPIEVMRAAVESVIARRRSK